MQGTVTTQDNVLAARHINFLLRATTGATILCVVYANGVQRTGKAGAANLDIIKKGVAEGRVTEVLAGRGDFGTTSNDWHAVLDGHVADGEWYLPDFGWTCRTCGIAVPLGRRAFCDAHGKRAQRIHEQCEIEAEGDGTSNRRYHDRINRTAKRHPARLGAGIYL